MSVLKYFLDKQKLLCWSLLVIILGLVLRWLPMYPDNFYFTVDQGDDAVQARQWWYRHQLPLVGQGTSIKGVYHGPYWIWLIGIGFWLFDGHPLGALTILIIINLSATILLVRKLAQKTSLVFAVFTGLSLQVFWPFYEVSRFAFSPFPLTAIAIVTVLFLTQALEKKPVFLIFAAFLIGFIWHTELASIAPFLGLFFLVCFWGHKTHLWARKEIMHAVLGLLVFFIPLFITETANGFPQFWALRNHLITQNHVFSRLTWAGTSLKMADLIGQSLIGQERFVYLGLVMAIAILIFFLTRSKPFLSGNESLVFIRRFVLLSWCLTFLTGVWFAMNQGWHPWHTVYIPPLLFLTNLLIIYMLPKKISQVLLLIILISQLSLFFQRYQEYFRPANDAGILHNQLKAIDWIYRQAENKGFYVYIYTPFVYDYPYQYLIWWKGLKKYGYLPCEYSTYPSTPSLYVPGLKHYQTPQKDCVEAPRTKDRFLIIEPDQNKANQNAWLTGIATGTTLVAKAFVGSITIEQRWQH